MTKTIREWQKAAYELACEKGFHSRECSRCSGAGVTDHEQPCRKCAGSAVERIDPHSPTRIAARLALIHAEISEAGECVARGDMSLYFVRDNLEASPRDFTSNEVAVKHGYKPEGFPIELADVFLRLCDLAESLGHSIAIRDVSGNIGKCDSPEGIAAGLFQLHQHLSDVYAFTYIGVPSQWDGQLELDTFASLLLGFAAARNIDLLAMAELKHEYERSRL